MDLDVVMAEEMSAKVVHAAPGDSITGVQMHEMSAVIHESMNRPDYGVDVVWTPENSAAGRPTAIYARGVASLATAALEMQTAYDPNSKAKSPVAHFVFSLSTEESATTSNEQLIKAAVATLDGMTLPDSTATGWAKHALVAVVHEDTMKWSEPDANGERRLLEGNRHCHVMVCSKNNEGVTFDRTQEYMRLHRSLRERELEFHMKHDWGLYAIREHGVERSNSVDWEARRQEKAIDRAERQASNFLSDVSGLATERDWTDRIHHKVREYLAGCRDREEVPLQSDIHIIANRLSLHVEGVIDGQLTFRMMERAEPGEHRKTWVDHYGDTRHIAARWKPTETLITLDEKRVARSPLETQNQTTLQFEAKKSKKPPHEWLVAKHEGALQDREWLRNVGSLEVAEAEYLRVIAADPGRVSRDYVNGRGKATFTFDDLEETISRHVTNDWAGVTEQVIRADAAIRIVRNPDEVALARGDKPELRPFSESKLYTGVDGNSPLFTIETQRDKTEKFDRLLRHMLAMPDPDFDRAALDKAIAVVLTEERKKNPTFDFDREQYQAMASFNRALTVVDGPPGSGKTALNSVHRVYAELTNREIRGFTTAEKAAGVLEGDTGVKSANQLRALTQAAREGRNVMPARARFIFDEFSTADIDAATVMLEAAIAQKATGVFGGGLDQLQNIGAGRTFGIAARAALDLQKEAGGHAFTRLKQTYRQQSPELDFMKREVRKGSKAINTAHRVGFTAYLENFRALATVHRTRADAIAAGAADIVAAMRNDVRIISPIRSYEDCLYVSRQVRDTLGLAGKGTEFTFNKSTLELAVGDHILFRENRGTDPNATYTDGRSKLYVRNGDVGTIQSMKQSPETQRWDITVKLDNDRIVSFDPTTYHDIEYAYASTTFANQGSKAQEVVLLVLPSSDARDIQVGLTRATHVLKIHTHEKWDDIIERLASEKSLAPADDSLLFQNIVKRTGGPHSPWARAVETAMNNAADPLRQQHRAAESERSHMLQTKIVAILDTAMPVRERNQALTDVAAQYPAQSFVSWCASRMDELQAEYALHERSLSKDITLEAVVPIVVSPQVTELRAKAALEELEFQQILRDREERKVTDKRDRNMAVARAALQPLVGSDGESYWRRRGLTPTTGVFYAHNWGEGFETNNERDGNPVISRGHGPAVVFEIFNLEREVIGLQGHYLNPPEWMKDWTVGSARGLMATPGAWDTEIKIIAEGGPDMFTYAALGQPAFGIPGTQSIPKWIAQAFPGNTILAGDPDAAGRGMMEKLELELGTDRTTRIVLPTGIDANDHFTHGMKSELLASLSAAQRQLRERRLEISRHQ